MMTKSCLSALIFGAYLNCSDHYRRIRKRISGTRSYMLTFFPLSLVLFVEIPGKQQHTRPRWILRGGEAACPAVAEPPVRTDGATRLLTITRVRRGECHRPHALNGLSLDLLHGC